MYCEHKHIEYFNDLLNQSEEHNELFIYDQYKVQTRYILGYILKEIQYKDDREEFIKHINYAMRSHKVNKLLYFQYFILD